MISTLGIIGCGNMGGAIARGILQKVCGQEPHASLQVQVFDAYPESLAPLVQLGARQADSALALVDQSQCVILAVKPDQLKGLLASLQPALRTDHILVSIAAGVPLAALKTYVSHICPVIRVMPNTLITVGHGACGVCLDDPNIQTEHGDFVRAILSAFGQVFVLPEKKFNAFSALAGCGPAYAFYVAEALAEAGVVLGLERKAATEIALSLLAGSAALAEQSGVHLSQLREQVTSPGGVTIAGTHSLDASAVRGNIISAVVAAYDRSKEMEKE